jgi:O-antigen/teichoic acid export membrane protein
VSRGKRLHSWLGRRRGPGGRDWEAGELVGSQTGVPAPDAAAATTGEALLVGGLWSTASRVVPQLYVLILSVAAARFLGPEGMGRQSFIAFVALSSIMLVTGGLPIALMRFVGETLGRREPGKLRGLIGWAWWIEGAGAAVGGAILVGVALLGADPRSAWLLAAMGSSLGILHTVPSSLLIGAQRWRAASVVGLVTGTLTTVATIGVLWAGGGITGMFAVEVVTSALNLAWTTALARRALAEIAPRGEPAGELTRQVLRYALPASLGVFLTFLVWRRSEFFFLERYSTDTEIALYSISFAVVTALGRLFEAVAAVVSPAVATLAGAGEIDRIRTGYGRALRLLTVLTLPLTAVGLALGPATLRLLYGEGYRNTGPVLLIMLATFPVVSLVRTSNALLHGLGRLRFLLAAGFLGAAVNVGLDFLLIPRHDSVGAALANGGGQLAVSIPVLVYASRVLGPVKWRPSAVGRAAAASIGSGLAGWAGVSTVEGGAGVAVGAAAASVTLVALARILRILPADDAAWLDRVAGGRLGGWVGRVSRALAQPSPAAP